MATTPTSSQNTGNPMVLPGTLGALIQNQSSTPVKPTGTTTAPAVVSSTKAQTNATQIQQTLNTKTAGQQQQSTAKQNLTTTYDAQGNMLITGGTMPNGTQYQQFIPKGSPSYIPNPADVKAAAAAKTAAAKTAADSASTTALTSAATATGADTTTPPAGTTLPTAPTTGTPNTSNPSSVPIPSGIDVTTQDGQIQWYNQNQQQFDQWAKDQGWSTSDLSNLHYLASVNQQNTDSASIKDALNQFQNGTYPLTPDQQAQLDATKQQFEQLIATQQLANLNYENGVRVLGEVTGRAQYFPSIAMADVQSAITSGNAKIADLTSKETSALATMRQGFDTNNFDMVTKAHTELMTIDQNITTNLKSIHDDIVAANQNAFNNAEKVAMDNWTQYVGQTDISLKEKTAALEQMKFTEQQKMDAEKILDDHIKNQIAEADLAIKQATFNADYGTPQLPANFKPTDIPGVREIAPGVAYFDPTQFNDAKQAQAAEKAARAVGIAIVDPKDAPNAETMQTALDNLNQAQQAFSKVATPNYFGSGAIHEVGNLIGGAVKIAGYTTNYQANLSAYNNARQTVIQLAGSLTGGNARALRAILTQLDNVLPSTGHGVDVVPTNTKDAAAKFSSARQLIYQGIKTLVPNATLPSTGYPIYTAPSDYIAEHPIVTLPTDAIYGNDAGKTIDSKTAFTDIINNLHTQHPEYTTDELQQGALYLVNY